MIEAKWCKMLKIGRMSLARAFCIKVKHYVTTSPEICTRDVCGSHALSSGGGIICAGLGLAEGVPKRKGWFKPIGDNYCELASSQVGADNGNDDVQPAATKQVYTPQIQHGNPNWPDLIGNLIFQTPIFWDSMFDSVGLSKARRQGWWKILPF